MVCLSFLLAPPESLFWSSVALKELWQRRNPSLDRKPLYSARSIVMNVGEYLGKLHPEEHERKMQPQGN